MFADGELLPALVHECVQRNVPLMLVGAARPRLPPGREGWFPGLIKSALQAFRHILVLDEAAARAFRKAGAGRPLHGHRPAWKRQAPCCPISKPTAPPLPH